MFEIILSRFFEFPFLNSISIRAMIALFISFLFCIVLIPQVKKKVLARKLGQQIRECGPEAHLEKQGNATMGGIAIVLSVCLVTLFFAKWNPLIMISLFVFLTLAICGFIDDILKIYKKNSDGLNGKYKMLFQFLVSIFAIFVVHNTINGFEYVQIPCFGIKISNDILYYIIFILTITASSNAVNLTDGLDGLAGGVLIVVALVYSAITYISGNVIYSSHLGVPYITGAGELTVLTASLIGSLIGFLWFNSYPAQIFMGDTGSLALGGLIGILAVFTKTEILLIVTGGIFVIEALSVIIQVLSYKLRKKRVFRMAPIHHHFELSGLHETKVVIRMWIISLFLAVCGFLLFIIGVLFK
ncbi:MAG: phospho-N-acetylmuramoyl-pentapeptide-transferase [Candidatus Muirbacterium halophilum]|nr:phospho-N-acetylmuramoyl-pentapeptide-transferase [Candidatus Muirbacterium halophilum]MCK9475425.1 phospho-N-acetylmuramoyl-pentapeptide-transferase [Candidatus Muirbacterium halophilum]